MEIAIKVPNVGESITEGSIARWLKKDGETVQLDEPLFELETEKASTEVPAPATGKVRIAIGEGERVAIGAVIGSIDTEAALAETKPAKPPPSLAEPKPDGRAAPPPATAKPPRLEPAVEQRPEPRPTLAAPTLPPAPVAPAGRETRQRMSPIRQRIAERLLQSQRATASLTTFNEADLTAIMEARNRYKESFKKKYGVSLGFMSFFVKATVEALKAYPVVNARIEDQDVVYCHYYNIGVAVSTEKGLLVPVVRDADRLSFADIEKAIAEAAAKARDGKLAVTDLQGGTFTITNGGVFGSMLSTPILNPPQSAILGMHAIQERPVVRDKQIVIRPMMYLALTYDHRLIDGRDAVLFLVRVKECVENPVRLLLGT